MRRIGAAGIVLAALVVCPPAEASDSSPEDARNEQTDESALALFAGAGVTFASLTTGGLMIGLSKNELVKNGGLLGSQSGMVLAPFVAHAVVGETLRGIWWSLPLLVPVATNSVFTGIYPSIIKRAPAGVQYATFISFTISVIGSSIGVLDAVRVGERRPKKSLPLEKDSTWSWSVVPMVGGGTAGAMISGSL